MGRFRSTRRQRAKKPPEGVLPWHRRSSYEPDAPARGVPQSPRWRVGLVCARMRNFLAGVISLPSFEQLLVFPLGDEVSRALEPVEEHDATEVILLVLEDTGDEACELAFDLLASGGLVAGPDAAMAANLATDSGDAQAAFPTFDHVLGSLQNLRVDHNLGLHP